MPSPIKIQGIRVRFNKNDGVELKTQDLARSTVANVRVLANADRDRDGWVTASEVLSTQGLPGSAYFLHEDLMNAARKKQFGGISVVGLRAKVAAGEHVTAALPPRLGAANANLAHLPRSAFLPLAQHLAMRLAAADSYESSYGAGAKIFHTDVSEVFRGRSRHEMYAALSILASREGGVEFALSRSEDGRVHLVQGEPDRVELDSVATGLDLILHTHPRSGADGARPSQGDFFSCANYDADHVGRVASDDGWFAEYSTKNGQVASEPRRLWDESK